MFTNPKQKFDQEKIKYDNKSNINLSKNIYLYYYRI